MAITVQLYYVPTKKLLQDFEIHTFKSHETILQNIAKRFDDLFVAVYTQDAKQQPQDLSNVLEGQILLVTPAPLEPPQPYAPFGFKLYRVEEAGSLRPDLPRRPWIQLTDVERKEHIISFGARKPETRNTLRIAEPHPAIVVDLNNMTNASAEEMKTTYSIVASQQKIVQNWGLQFAMWLPEDNKPTGSMMNYNWDPRMVASVAILAKATPGQGHIVKEILKDIVDARVPTEQDVLDIITRIYERAGLIAQHLCSPGIHFLTLSNQ